MGALPIVKLHEYQIVLFVKKTLHDKSAVPDIFHDYYRNASSVHRQNTRSSSLNLFVTSVKITLEKDS